MEAVRFLREFDSTFLEQVPAEQWGSELSRLWQAREDMMRNLVVDVSARLQQIDATRTASARAATTAPDAQAIEEALRQHLPCHTSFEKVSVEKAVDYFARPMLLETVTQAVLTALAAHYGQDPVPAEAVRAFVEENYTGTKDTKVAELVTVWKAHHPPYTPEVLIQAVTDAGLRDNGTFDALTECAKLSPNVHPADFVEVWRRVRSVWEFGGITTNDLPELLAFAVRNAHMPLDPFCSSWVLRNQTDQEEMEWLG